MIIYKITNKLNGKVYIGQTIYSLSKRFTNHCNVGKGAIGEAIKKYGKENFTAEIIDKCETIDQLNEREQYWIKFYKSISPNGYNLAEGGTNKIVHLETRKKMSNSRKGYIMPDSTKKKLSEINKGKVSGAKGYRFTDEQREHQRKATLGNTNKRGKSMSEESKKKLSESIKLWHINKNKK